MNVLSCNRRAGWAGLCLAAVLAAGTAEAALTLTPDPPSPQPSGTPVTWTASYDGTGQFVYRFQVAFLDASGQLEVVQDFSPETTFVWAPVTPGSYQVAVTVRRVGNDTNLDVTTASYFVSNPGASQPVVRTTDHPLVRLYAAPPCADAGDDLALEIRRPSDPWARRVVKPCVPQGATISRGVCFWVAGLRTDTTYLARHVELTSSGEIASDPVRFRTGAAAPANVATCSPSIPWTGAARPEEPFLLVAPPPESPDPVPFAVDAAGRLVWYDDGPDTEGEVALVTTISDDGTILELVSSGGVQDQILREIDPAGHAVRRTSVPRINSQLAAMGAPDTITSFFHEAIRLDDGTTLVGCAAERMLDGVQGIPAGQPEDVVGNMIVALDNDWQVTWYWDAFEKMDLDRAAVLGEHCGYQTPGCPPLRLASIARDWTHGNCLVPAWDTGDLLYSLRHQDWIVLIDYDNGTGSGDVLASVGRDGSLVLGSGDPTEWFSHQHGIAPLSLSGNFLLFDNGNTRCDGAGPDCHSRGQRWQIEQGSIWLQENLDLGAYSEARGMSQLLASGARHYSVGTLGTPSAPSSRSVQFDGAGQAEFELECGTWAYRTYRLKSLEAPR